MYCDKITIFVQIFFQDRDSVWVIIKNRTASNAVNGVFSCGVSPNRKLRTELTRVGICKLTLVLRILK